jgi:pSer/pThr/pTyr-binding forkhead associated (FHA) protein
MTAALLPVAAVISGGAVPYRTQLQRLAQTAPADALVPLQLSGRDPDVMATHVVYRGRALPITAAGVVIGRDPGDGAGLRLPEGLAGLSRRHCTLRREGGRSQVIDHSSHGSFLDGARVRGRALLPAGSTLKLGEPGIELALVALDAAE